MAVVQHCAQQDAETKRGSRNSSIFRLHDMGMEKGKTPATKKAVAKVVSRGKATVADVAL